MTETSDRLCGVVRHREILPGVFRTVLQCPEISAGAKPGQFVQIEPSSGVFPLTRRPFTVNRVVEDGFEVIFDVVGRGTGVMSRIQPGNSLRVLGPLGKGWRTERGGNWLLIGGGLGAAGFPFLMDTVHCSGILVGASSSNRVLPLGDTPCLTIATEDGSAGRRGLVTGIVREEDLQRAENIALCGPVAMMEAVWNTVPEVHRSKIQVSTESRMGCGWGVCDGCSIPLNGGGYRKCCLDGPVFPGGDIDWKRWKEAGL